MILVMGTTGSGKSYFINRLARRNEVREGHKLRSGYSSDLLRLDWTRFRLKSSPLRFYRDLAPGAPYNLYTIYSKSWHSLVLQ